MLTAPPIPAAAPARTSDIPPENAAYMLPAMCPEAGLPPTSVLVHRDSSGTRPEFRPREPVKAALDRVWAMRSRLSGLCLEYAAYAAAKTGQEDRALHLMAVGNVREAYDRARCLPPGEHGYSQYGDAHGIAQMMLVMDVTLFKTRGADWLRLSKSAAGRAATYDYPVDLKRVCDLSGPRPENEWPQAREKVAAAVLAVQLPSPPPKIEAPAGAVSPPAPPREDRPSPPAPSGSPPPRP